MSRAAVLLLASALAGACDARPPRAATGSVGSVAATAPAPPAPTTQFPVTWAAALDLASQGDVPRRLATATRDSLDAAIWTAQCTPTGACTPVDTVFTSTCAEFAAARRRQLAVTTAVDIGFAEAVAVRCAALDAIAKARPARQSAVRDVRLTPALLDSLPAGLGLIVLPEDSERVAAAERAGKTLKGADPALKGSVETFGRADTVLRGRSQSQEVLVSVFGRGDFDGDGWDDVLAKVITGAVGGSFTSQQLWLLTRRAPGERLRAVRRLW